MKHLIIVIPEADIDRAEIDLLNFFQVTHCQLLGNYLSRKAGFRNIFIPANKYSVSTFWENAFTLNIEEYDFSGYSYLIGVAEDIDQWLSDNNIEAIPVEGI